jgi:hypothetical protein
MFLFLVYLAFLQTENSVVETKKNSRPNYRTHIVPQSPRLIFLDELTGRGAFAGIILLISNSTARNYLSWTIGIVSEIKFD